MNRKLIGIGAAFLLMLGFLACDPPETNGAAEGNDGDGEVTEDGPSGIDNAGITEFPDDPALVEEGEELFSSLGCAGCHQMGRDGAGPALGDVAERRSAAWIARIIIDPAGMRDQDPEAAALSENFPAPMISTTSDPDQIKAILAYLNAQ